MKREFNTNSHVYVMLNERGLKELERQHNKRRKEFPDVDCFNKPFEKPEEDENGYSKWQLWNLMIKLGPIIGPGFGDIAFETTILIDEKDLK